VGPIIPITLALPDDAQRAYIDRNESPPSPIKGYALIDTGASNTCFDLDVAHKAGLPIVGLSNMASASRAKQQVPTFAGKIICPTLTINVNEGMGAKLFSLNNKLIALLGRDILKSAILIYNGPAGHFSLAN